MASLRQAITIASPTIHYCRHSTQEGQAGMTLRTPTLPLMCDKTASGKSSLTARLAAAVQTARISNDILLAQRFLAKHAVRR